MNFYQLGRQVALCKEAGRIIDVTDIAPGALERTGARVGTTADDVVRVLSAHKRGLRNARRIRNLKRFGIPAALAAVAYGGYRMATDPGKEPPKSAV